LLIVVLWATSLD